MISQDINLHTPDIDLMDLPLYQALRLLAQDARDTQIKEAASLIYRELIPRDTRASKCLARIRPRVSVETRVTY